jgi:hypothetical protein
MGANAQTAVPAFVSGEVLTAAEMTQVNTGIPVFATTVTRDAAFGGTGEKVLAQGQYAFIEATNQTQFYDGSAWQTLGGGLTLVKAQTIGSGVSTVTVTGAFSATYDTYLVTVSGGVASADLALNMTLGATATGYYWIGNNIQYGAATTNTNSGSNVASFASVAYGSTNALSGECFIDNPFATKRTMVRYQATGSSTTYFINTNQGFLNDATSYTAFTFTTSSGTITGGTIRVYGYTNG